MIMRTLDIITGCDM